MNNDLFETWDRSFGGNGKVCLTSTSATSLQMLGIWASQAFFEATFSLH